MFEVTISRPNTIGKTKDLDFENYLGLSDWIFKYIGEKLEEGWNDSWGENNSQEYGSVELTHEKHADLILIEWQKVSEV
jgi:hypothetical protein